MSRTYNSQARHAQVYRLSERRILRRIVLALTDGRALPARVRRAIEGGR